MHATFYYIATVNLLRTIQLSVLRQLVLRVVIVGCVLSVVGSLLLQNIAYAITSEERDARIEQYEREAASVEEQLFEYQERLEHKQQQLQLLDHSISSSADEVADLSRGIAVSEGALQALEGRRTELQQRIVLQEATIHDRMTTLRSLFRAIDEYESQTLVELMLKEETLSDALNVIERLRATREQFQSVLTELRAEQARLQVAYDHLRAEQRLERIQQQVLSSQKILLEQELFAQQQAQQQYEVQAGEYRDAIADALAARDEIDHNIYRLQLQGVSQDFALGDIQALATQVSERTGVRAAFLMAVLKQESNLGANTGTAHYVDAYTCNGNHDINDEYVQRQISEFKRIAEGVGRDPETTKVSACPGYGSGGAMGPAQFMPLTWIGYEAKVAELLGKETADPWELADAMIAMGLKMAKAGADAQTREAEHNAALIYFSGGVNHKYDWYAESILKIADEYETEF